MQPSKSKFEIGKKIFARYTDEYNDLQINFIPTYIIEDNGDVVIGIKNDMVGTQKGYFNVKDLTGKSQLNSRFLFNIFTKKSKD